MNTLQKETHVPDIKHSSNNGTRSDWREEFRKTYGHIFSQYHSSQLNNAIEFIESRMKNMREELFYDSENKALSEMLNHARLAAIAEIEEKVKGMKCDERKVAEFAGYYEAVTYSEKQLVNAVISDILSLLSAMKK